MAITKLNSLAIPPDTVVESDISFPLDSASFTGDLTVDTDTLVVDSTANMVGFGTDSPSNKIHVYEATTGYATIKLSGTQGSTPADYQIRAHDGVLDFRNASTAAIPITLNADNDLGIGIQAADARLHVYKNNDGEEVVARFENRQNLSANTATSLAIRADQAEARIRVDRDGGGNGASLVFGTTSAGTLGDRVTIDPLGNVGIGKDPSAKLDVDVGSSSTLSRFETTNTTLARQYMYGGTTGCQVDIAFLQNNVLQSVIGTDRTTGDTFIDSRSTNGDTVFYRTGSERVRIKSGGNLQIIDGNLVVANGHGVSFAATGQASGMTNEVLDDYEEGTWTPVYKTSNGDHSVASYHNQVGTYTKIGNTVFVSCYMYINSLTSAGTGNPYIDGLPFPKVGGEMRFPLVNYNIAAQSSTYPFATGYANYNESVVRILLHRQVGVWTQATTAGSNQFLMQSGSLISFTGTYLTS